MEEFETLGKLASEGKLDRALRLRLAVFIVVVLLCGAAAFYDVVSYRINAFLLIGFASASMLLGLFIFSRMNTIEWNEEREVVMLKRFDVFGTVMLVLYILIRIVTKSFLDDYFHNVVTVSAITYATVFGVMLGRLFGILITIHKVHAAKSKDFGN